MQSFPNTTALRSHLDHQVSFFTELTQKSFDMLRTISQLQLQLGQQLMQDSVEAGRAYLNCTTPFEFGPAVLRQAAPVSQHVREYQQALMQACTGAQSELVRTTESHMPEASRGAAAAAEEFARSAAEAGEAFMTRH
jgi:phasin family protein